MRKLYTNLFGLFAVAMLAVAGFNTSNADSQRMVVLEQFTSTTCPPCAAVNPALHAGLVPLQDIAIPLVYHVWYPAPGDPMFNADQSMNQARCQYYGTPGIPAVSLNGAATVNGATLTNANFQQITSQRGVLSPIDMEVTRSGNKVTVKVVSSQAFAGHKLRVVIVERDINYSVAPGSNGETHFPWVPRQMLPNAAGTDITLAAGVEQEFEFTMNPRSEWDMEQIYAAAFVQNEGTKEVMQGATSIAFVSNTVANNNTVLESDMTHNVEVTFSNPSTTEMTATATVGDASIIPDGWTVNFETTPLTIPAGGTATATAIVTVPAGSPGYLQLAPELDVQSFPMKVEAIATNGNFISDAVRRLYIQANHSAPEVIDNEIAKIGWSEEYASMPLNNDFLQNLDVSQLDMVIMAADYTSIGRLATGNFYALAQQYMTQGVNVLIFSNLDVYNGFAANNGQGVPSARNFFSSIGVGNGGDPIQVVQVNGNQISGYDQIMLSGVQDLFDGYTAIANTPTQAWPYRKYFIDRMTVNGSSGAEVLLNGTAKGQTVPVMVGNDVNGTKVVLSTVGLENISNQGQREALMSTVETWFADGVVERAIATASVTSLDFGVNSLNQPKEMSFEVTNDGNIDLTMEFDSDNSFFGYPDNFKLVNESDFPATVAPGQSVTVTVEFTATESDNYSDFIEFITNTNDEVLALEVSGTGTDGSGPAAMVLSSTSIDFGSVKTNESKEMTLTISNDGATGLTLSSIALEGMNSPFSIMNSQPAINITPGGDFQLMIEYAPTSEGNHSETLTFASNDPNNLTVEVALTGVSDAGSVREIVAEGFSIVAQPNVFSGSTNLLVDVRASLNSEVELTLVDATGKKVRDISNGNLTAGAIKLDANGLNAGKYFVVANYNGQSHVMSVIVQ
ncbi:MAG: hypothetical protein Kapaf2KO_16340 [Candidatus Kapaibacteriales bacterium]